MRPVVRTSISFSPWLSGPAVPSGAQRCPAASGLRWVAAKVFASTYWWASREHWLMAMTSGGGCAWLGLKYRPSGGGLWMVMECCGWLWMIIGYYRYWLLKRVQICFWSTPHSDVLRHILVDQILLSRKISLQNLSLQPDPKTQKNHHTFTLCLLHVHDSYDEQRHETSKSYRLPCKRGTRNHCTKARAASACVCSGGLMVFKHHW